MNCTTDSGISLQKVDPYNLRANIFCRKSMDKRYHEAYI